MQLVFDFIAFVVFAVFVVSGVGSGAGWNADSKVGSRVAFISKLFVVNNLLLKLLITLSLALKINPNLFKKHHFKLLLYPNQNSSIQ